MNRFHIPVLSHSKMKRITPRTCLWPLTGVLCATFALSIGLTYQSNHHCYAGTCGEWLFPLQARLHVIVWYMWISLSVAFLGLRAFQPSIRNLCSKPLKFHIPLLEKQLRVSGILLISWLCVLYGILITIWWVRLRDYFQERGGNLPGNNIVAAVALTGHLADVTMGMVLLPVSRHSALASFFKLSPTTTYTFHMVQAYLLFGLVIIHGSLYAAWAALYNQNRSAFRQIFPVLNPTYLYHEVWPGNTSALGTWRASLVFSGSISALIMLAMFLTSFPIIRRFHFNLFYFTHLLGIIAVVVICLHASTMFYCTIPGLAMWLLDWGMRLAELRTKLDCRLTFLGKGWYSLRVPLPRKRLSGCACHSPLAHFYIHHSESSIREIHPFTTTTHLASKSRMTKDEDCISIQFLFRQSNQNSSKQWTGRLASLIDGEELEAPMRDVKTKLRLEGPYFTPANPETFKTVICLVAGTGLSGALAITTAFHAQKSGAVSNTCWERCIVIWSVREDDYVDLPYFKELQCEGVEFRIHKTGGTHPRLDMTKTLTEICGEEGEDSWCYISGPSGFITAAEWSSSQIKNLTWFAARWD